MKAIMQVGSDVWVMECAQPIPLTIVVPFVPRYGRVRGVYAQGEVSRTAIALIDTREFHLDRVTMADSTGPLEAIYSERLA